MRRFSCCLLLLTGCAGKGDDTATCGATCDTSVDTSDTNDTADSNETDSNETDTAETDTAETDTAETDTSIPDPCPTATVTFEHPDLTTDDLTEAFSTGTYVTFDQPGRLLVCPGTWYARTVVRASIEVVGLGASPADTILSGGESGSIFDASGKGILLSVSNVTLDRGFALGKEHNSGGGGIYCDGFGAITVEDTILSNHKANDGPAIYVEDCEVTVRHSTFLDNVAEDDGGALTIWYSNATLEDVTFTDNVALDGGGMALFYGSATLSGVTFEGNTAGNFSSGLWVYNSTVAISDSDFTNNTDTDGTGGGMILYGSGTLDHVRFTDNAAPQGGGLYVYYEAVVEGTACDFSGNTPDDIYGADYSAEGGVSYTAGMNYSFSCASNVCTAG